MPDYEAILAQIRTPHPHNNVSSVVSDKVGRNLHLQPHHPLHTIKVMVERFCAQHAASRYQQGGEKRTGNSFRIFDRESPVVSTQSCFDDLLVPPDHVSRSLSDTYYINDTTLMRAHTSAHQCQFLRQGESAFLCSGDVYRRDEIDSSHYPVFHQMEGVRIFSAEELAAGTTPEEKKKIIEKDLQELLMGLARELFGEVEMRWSPDYFPFTAPSFELEVLFRGRWLEVLGCGVVHDQVMRNAGRGEEHGWAFGLGLERLAMVLFDIPDIRLFWSQDERFLSQFQEGQITKFVSYSKYPPVFKDVSFWLPAPSASSSICDNDIYEVIRDVAGDLIEAAEKFDEFTHPKTGRQSQAYRITYRDMNRNLTNEEVDELQWKVRAALVDLGVELR